MKRMKWPSMLPLLGVLALNATPAPGQVLPEMPDYKERIIDPQTALMNMYGDYPVDLANGLVDISIPLHTVSTPWFSFPISAKFHASGLWANEMEGLMGVRWLMDATYSISRAVRGYPDDHLDDAQGSVPYAFDNRVSRYDYDPDFATLWGTLYAEGRHPLQGSILHDLSNYTGGEGHWNDTEYDIFTYHLPSGRSGKFILQDSAGVKIPRLIPYEPLRIEIRKKWNVRFEFTITDEQGVAYRYDWMPIDPDDPQEWKLKTITAPDGRDSIVFDYVRSAMSEPRRFTERTHLRSSIWTNVNQTSVGPIVGPPGAYIFLESCREMCQEYFGEFFESEIYDTPEDETIPLFGVSPSSGIYAPSAIRFKGGRLAFNYELRFSGHYLTSMEVLDHASVPVKKIVFDYVQPSGNATVKPTVLDKLTIVDPRTGAGSGGAYRFGYHNLSYYPNLQPKPDGSLRMEADWWGYYRKGAYNLIYDNVRYDKLPIEPNPSPFNNGIATVQIGETSVDKNSGVEDMKAGMLARIEYPTGGRTEFEYESNRYLSRQGVSTPCGGLRIKSVKNIAADGKSEIKTYLYNSQGGNGSMPDHLYPPNNRGGIESKNFLTETAVDNIFWWNTDAEDYSNGSIGTKNAGSFSYSKFTYDNLLPGQFTIFHSNTVFYDRVVEYRGTEKANQGRTQYDYTVTLPETQTYETNFLFERSNAYNSRQLLHVLPPAYGRSAAQLNKKTVYDSAGQAVEETEYRYTIFDKGSVYDMPIQRLWQHKIGGLIAERSDYAETFFSANELRETEYTDITDFAWLNQEYRLGATRLHSETVKRHTPEGTVTTVKTTEHDPTYLLPIRETVTTSGSGESYSTEFKYPWNYTAAPYPDMVRKNILSPVVETSFYKGSTLLQTDRNSYKHWLSGYYAPQYFYRRRQGGTEERRQTYDYYMHYANGAYLRAVTQDNTQKVVYLRDAAGQPVAVIDGVDYPRVAALLGSALIDRLAAAFAVTTTDQSALNNLRTQLAGEALVTTYTYRPLVGISSATDPSGRKTSYEYDNLGRLTFIRDEEGNILEKYEYHFMNQ